MTSDDKPLGAGWDKRSPLPSSDMEETRPYLADGREASGEATGNSAGLLFVTRKDTELASAQEGVVTLSSSQDPKVEELWKTLEGVMAARQSSVREVMEEFGVADVPPVIDELEEQLWQVVEGELTLQEAADLV